MRDANDIASFSKVCQFSENLLKQALKQAQAGWFDAKSWHFWHIKLYGTHATIPPFPQRGHINETRT